MEHCRTQAGEDWIILSDNIYSKVSTYEDFGYLLISDYFLRVSSLERFEQDI